MCPPPKAKKFKTPAPIKPPEIQLANQDNQSPGAQRRRKQSGRNQLRTGINVPGGQDNGLSIQT